MSRTRVVITGMGAISALGENVSQHVESLREGTNGITHIDRRYYKEEAFTYSGYAGIVQSIPTLNNVDRRLMGTLDRGAILGLVATAEANT